MPKMPKEVNESKLICITGFMGEGKTTSIKFFSNLGYETFITDEWIHKIYKKGKQGYKLIRKLFGKKYTNSVEVDRKKLKELIISNKNAKHLLEKNINKLIFKRINSLRQKKTLIFVELGTYLYFFETFDGLFNKIICITNNQKNNKIDNFKKFSLIKKFSTKPVGNLKNIDIDGTFYVDFIVENKLDTTYLKKQLFFLLKNL